MGITNQNHSVYNHIATEQQEYFDRNLAAMKSVISAVSISDIPKKIINHQITNSIPYYDISEYKKFVTDLSLQVEHPFFTSFYVPDYSVIVSEKGIFTAEKYCRITYPKIKPEEFLTLLNNEKDYFTFASNIIYCYKTNNYNSIIFFAEMDREMLAAKADKLLGNDSLKFFMTDKNGNILINEDGTNTNLDEKYPENKYLHYDKPSTVSPWKYCLVFKNSLALNPVKQISLLILADLLICILAALIYISFSVKKHSTPVVALLNEIGSLDEKGANYSYALDMAKKQLSAYKKTSEKNLQLAKRKAFIDLLHENKSKTAEITFEHEFPQFNKPLYTVILIKPDQSALNVLYNSGYNEADISVIFINIFEELLNESYTAKVFPVEDIFAALVNTEQDNVQQDLLSIIGKAFQVIEKNFSLRFYSTISTFESDLSKLGTLYQNSLETLNYAEFMQMYTPLPCSQFDDNSDGITTLFSVEQKNNIVNYLKNGDTQKALEEFNNVIDTVSKNIPISEFASNLKNEIIIITTLVIDSVVSEHTDSIEALVNFTNTLTETTSYNDLRLVISSYFTNLDTFTRNYSMSQNQTTDMLGEIIEFINKNYTNPNLCAQMICDEFHLHPVYLSRMFKEKLQTGMLQYVTNLRIEKSKELLADINLSISDILTRVGYTNIRTFNRCFKNAENTTPNNWRKQVINK